MREVIIYPGTEQEKRGLFHCWGLGFVEDRDGNGSYSIAIIELEDGRIVEHLPEKIKFVTPEMKK